MSWLEQMGAVEVICNDDLGKESGSMISTRQIRIVIVGGVAGGASAAARARRLNESAHIVLFERGPHASFANCGLPYYLGGEISDRNHLLVADPEMLEGWLNLDVRTRTEVVAIDRIAKEVEVHNIATDRRYREPFDFLILSTGAAPLRPTNLLAKVGLNHPRVLSLRNLEDIDRLKAIVDSGIRTATVLGGGFIGVEVAEQLVHRGVTTTLVEKNPQVLPPFDAEMVVPIEQALVERGVALYLSDGVVELEPEVNGRGIRAILADGRTLTGDLVVLAIGVQPESILAKTAGIEINDRGAIKVNAYLQTNDPNIYAVGDVIEVPDPILGGSTYIPLAGPANRQGRLAADHIVARVRGEDGVVPLHRGSQGSAIVRVFDLTAAMTGKSEKALQRSGKERHRDYEVIYVHPFQHAHYYPGAKRLTIKLIFETSSGRILGAQAVGEEAVDKRIDVLAMAIQMGATVFDLEQAELCYSPQYGSAKDAINLAGFQASNVLRGSTIPITPAELRAALETATPPVVVDVRSSVEFDKEHIPGAINIPLPELRTRMGEVPTDRPAVTYCAIGQRGYIAERLLRQQGVTGVRNLTGGFASWQGLV
ncbi:MAG: FAD-dependent oxidoreductase [Nitrospira sp.]|nr:FAD-dependent oxidoreductase [Nitrospira sp.]